MIVQNAGAPKRPTLSIAVGPRRAQPSLSAGPIAALGPVELRRIVAAMID